MGMLRRPSTCLFCGDSWIDSRSAAISGKHRIGRLQNSVHHESIQSGGCRPELTCKRPRAITSRSEWDARFTIIGSVSVNEQLRGAPGLEDIPAAPRVLDQGRWLTPLYPKAHPRGHAVGMAILLQSTSTSTRCPPIHFNSPAWG